MPESKDIIKTTFILSKRNVVANWCNGHLAMLLKTTQCLKPLVIPLSES